MNPDAVEVFTAYFGDPHRLYMVFAVLLFVVLGFTWMMITTKAMKERSTDRDVDDASVLGVVLRGLMLLLIMTAVFYVDL